MLTVLDVILRSAGFLERKGVESARLNAEWLIAHALGVDRMRLYMQFDRPLEEAQLATMRELVARRAKREPLQYILGTAPFHELTLKVDARALVPRPETEQLVELVLSSLTENDLPYRILDLGTGSGAIALALAFSLPRARILAVDASEAALALARENGLHCGLQNRVEFRRSDWFSAVEADERFDLIVSNPPYLTEAELESSEPEVREHEPNGALVAGVDGMRDLRYIAGQAFERLEPGGRLWLETGIAHHESLTELCFRLGYANAEGLTDWSGRPRFFKAQRTG